MPRLTRVIDYLTLGSDRPVRRLVAYYSIIAVATALLIWGFPGVMRQVLGAALFMTDANTAPVLLPDGLAQPPASTAMGPGSLGELAITTTLALLGTLVLMLPVSWVYMSARRVPGHNQAVAQALLILPIVIAGVVFIVRDSLALALSLAGVVAAVRFRTALRDPRDTVFIFLAIAVGFAAGVHALAVGALVSLVFNFVLLLTWRYDFGRNVLAPTASSRWAEPLESLARTNGHDRVPDRELVLALTPGKVEALADRFEHVREVIGGDRKKPRYNAVLSITTDRLTEAQAEIEKVLERMTKRWRLDEVVTHVGKPSEMYYLVRVGKSVSREDLITAVRARVGDRVHAVDLEIGDAIRREQETVS